jgi:hypothetical protein
VRVAAVNQDPRTKRLDDRFVQRFGAIDHHQDGAIGIKPALDQVSQQRLAGRGVLGGAFPQPQYVLLAVALDADRRQDDMLGEVHSIDHQGDQRKPA